MKFKIGQVVADVGHIDRKQEKIQGYHRITGAAEEIYEDGSKSERYSVDGMLMTKKRIKSSYEDCYFDFQLRKLTNREACR